MRRVPSFTTRHNSCELCEKEKKRKKKEQKRSSLGCCCPACCLCCFSGQLCLNVRRHLTHTHTLSLPLSLSLCLASWFLVAASETDTSCLLLSLLVFSSFVFFRGCCARFSERLSFFDDVLFTALCAVGKQASWAGPVDPFVVLFCILFSHNEAYICHTQPIHHIGCAALWPWLACAITGKR